MRSPRDHGSARVGPLAASSHSAPLLDVDALLDDPHRRIIVCCGAGGVGKTTTSAALALRAAERGRKAVVLTIDPARRLAQSMGIGKLDNTPRPVPGVEGPGSLDHEDDPDMEGTGAEPGDCRARGSLDAMMLDMKRTFDEVVESQASPEKARQILNNPFYIAVSSSFAGTQEYMAMEKLGQLDKDARRTGRWDLIVVDTPPSRNALDFLDAPERLSSFLDGRFMRLLTAPARGPARMMTAGFGMVTNTLTKVIGAQVLRDMQAFVAAFDTLFGGFRQRAQKTFELLQAQGTAFLVVASPEQDALREAAYFVERLRAEDMPLAGVVVNRASSDPGPELSESAALAGAERMRDADGSGSADRALAAGLLELHADRKLVVARERRLRERFATSHPDVPAAVLPALPTDVHDLTGLRRVGDLLAGRA
ncbi:MAG: ArsA family ATPase [Marmoricola sp.]